MTIFNPGTDWKRYLALGQPRQGRVSGESFLNQDLTQDGLIPAPYRFQQSRKALLKVGLGCRVMVLEC